MGIKHSFNSAKSDGADATKVKPSDWNDDHEIDGDVDFGGNNVTNLADEAYNQTAWNGSLEAPTKNAIRDKIEALVLTGGGVTDFLALDDSPDAYTGFGGGQSGTGPYQRGALVGVNQVETALEFKYSTSEYLDIRDFGTVAGHLANITTAFQAALDAAVDGTFQSQFCRIRVPFVDNGTHTIDAITFPSPGQGAIIVEFDCREIYLTSPWVLPGGYVLRGLRHRSINFPHPYKPRPHPVITGPSGSTAIETDTAGGPATMILIENLEIQGVDAMGLYFNGTELATVKDCFIATSSTTLPAFRIESCFWIQVLNTSISSGVEPGGAVDAPALLMSTFENYGKNVGLVFLKDITLFNNGIKFHSIFGPSGISNLDIERVLLEGLRENGAMFHFDSTSGAIGGIWIRDSELADTISFTNTAYIRNVGGLTDGVVYQDRNHAGVFDPVVGERIRNFVMDFTRHDIVDGNFEESPASLWSGYDAAHGYQYKAPGAIDVRLLTAPVGLPWTVYTPLPIVQDPTLWVPIDGPETVTPVLGPDGSMMGGLVNANGGQGVTCYGSLIAFQNLFQGDVFFVGCWAHNPSGGTIQGDIGIEVFGSAATVVTLDNGYSYNLPAEFEDRIPGSGWRWVCRALRVTNTGFTNPCALRFRLGAGKEYFNPCAMLIPAADVALIDEVHLRHLERSLKGGWSPTNVRGDVGVLDHQSFKAGVFKATAKTFTTLPASPVAGMQAYITDSNTATHGSTAAGGGANKVMVWYNGTNWTVMGS